MTEPDVRRIFVVEDHPAIQAAYRLFIDGDPDLAVCAVVRLGADALRRLDEVMPDLILVDISLPDMDGLDLVRQLRERLPDLPILVVSGRESSRQAESALRAGATGYVDKMEADATLVPAVRAALGLPPPSP